MPSLLDHIDRFSYTAQSIQSSCRQAVVEPCGPYVRAVLHTDLGDKARDVDASELGLFTLVPRANSSVHTGDDNDSSEVQKTEVIRVEFPGATPLRKPAAGKVGRLEEKEPEVYAEAALKYLDRYQSIRPMPRAREEVVSIIERLTALRDDIERLSVAVEQNTQLDTTSATTVKDEERRIQELNLRIKQLRARKDVLDKKQKDSGAAKARKPLAKADSQEDAFWNESARPSSKLRTKARQSLLLPTLPSGDDSLLLDSNMDMGAMLGDTSMDSIADVPTPLPPARPIQPSTKEGRAAPKTLPSRNTLPEISTANQKLETSKKPPMKQKISQPDPSEEEQLDNQAIAESDSDDGDKTIMLKKPPIPSPPSSPPRAQSSTPAATQAASTPPREVESVETPATPAQVPGTITLATPGTGKKSSYKITIDVERIVAKIWSTVGDVIVPGHRFKTAAAATTNKPPKAKETLALLQNISTQSPPPSSPSTHSTLSLTDNSSSGQPTAHQILTAHLLLSLLSSPSYSMPLNKAKEALASKGLGGPPVAGGLSLISMGIGGQALETRALYGCVAKRLLKIDRGGREQIVKFDV